MFRPGVILIFMAVVIVHGALLLQLPGQDSTPIKLQQRQVIQAVLLAAPAAKMAENKKPAPKPKPLPKKKQPPEKNPVKEKPVQPPPQQPQKKVVEPLAEINQPTPEQSKKSPVPEAIPESKPPLPGTLPGPLPQADSEQVTVSPPQIGDAGHLKNPPPSYPRLSKRLREEGMVILELWVLADGSVSEVEIKTSSGYPRLDKAALKAVKKWRYTPATRNGKAVAYRYQQPVQFSMK